MKKNSSIYSILIFSLALFLSCSHPQKYIEQWRNATQLPGQLDIQFPLDQTLFPPEIAPTTVHWQDQTCAQQWFVIISTSPDEVLYTTMTNEQRFQPDSLLWKKMIRAGRLQQAVQISVMGIQGRKIKSGSSCCIHTSPDSVGAFVFYRAVPLPFIFALHNLDQIRWHLGDISSPQKAPALLQNLPLCGNCHSFTADGKTIAMDVDYANDKGSYIIKDIAEKTIFTPDDIITWSSYKQDNDEQTFGLLSQISPDGRYIASTVKDRSIFVAKEDLHYSQLFFPIKGIIVIYDRETGNFASLPGADDPQFVQSNPTWSPDGKWIYFVRAQAYRSKAIEQSKEAVISREFAEEFINHKRDFKFDIYRVPFNRGKGGQALPLKGASQNGKSNYFPRISPDGKHLCFCQAENFMLLQKDSKLYSIPAEGGTPHLLECNSDDMNSWHSWSPNSKWLVYSSKIRSAYTELLLTHIDENGCASPPVLLENLAFEKYAVNIPEFVNPHEQHWTEIVDNFSNQAHYYFSIGRTRAGDNQPQEAIKYFDRAIALDSTYAQSYVYKGEIYLANGKFTEALQAFEKAIKYINDDAGLYQNLGAARYKLKQYQGAIDAFTLSAKIDNRHSTVFLNRGLAFAKINQYNKAVEDYGKALKLDPNSATIYHERGICNAILQHWDKAIKDLETAAKFASDNELTWQKLATCYYQLKKYRKAIDSYSLAIHINPKNYDLYKSRGDCKYRLQEFQEALQDYSIAIEIQPQIGILYYRRGLVELRLNNKNNGCSDLAIAAQMGVSDAQILFQQQCNPN